MEPLAFARGPALAVALVVCVIGIAWRVYGIVRRPAAPDYAEPRPDGPRAPALRAIVSRMWHHRTFREATLVGTLNAYGYHIGLAIVFLGFVPHIAFIRRITGLAWPAVSGWLFAFAAAAVLIGLVYALVARLTSPVLRLLSSFDDYASWVVTALPVVTGMAVLSLPLEASYPATPLYPVPVAIHLLSFELLLVFLPFSKLAHAFLVFASRGATGVAFARKGAEL
jgi:nitrate reductase gamma subunit